MSLRGGADHRAHRRDRDLTQIPQNSLQAEGENGGTAQRHRIHDQGLSLRQFRKSLRCGALHGIHEAHQRIPRQSEAVKRKIRKSQPPIRSAVHVTVRRQARTRLYHALRGLRRCSAHLQRG